MAFARAWPHRLGVSAVLLAGTIPALLGGCAPSGPIAPSAAGSASTAPATAALCNLADPGPMLTGAWPYSFDRPLPRGFDWPELTEWSSHFKGASDLRIQQSAQSVWMSAWALVAIRAFESEDRARFNVALDRMEVADPTVTFVLPEHFVRDRLVAPARAGNGVRALVEFAAYYAPSYWDVELPESVQRAR